MKRTYFLSSAPYIVGHASVGGIRESAAQIGQYLDVCSDDDRFGKETWEDGESEIQRLSLARALEKSGLNATAIDAMYAGDLLNQCSATTFGLLPFERPFFGIFGACSTVCEGLILASQGLAAGMSLCSVTASSHNLAAERQFRYPVEYGGQKTPTAQWTVTGGASFLLAREPVAPPFARIVSVTPGRIVDSGIGDANNMGAAMAPAAADTFLSYFAETGSMPGEYDLLLTGDLGAEGSELFRILMKQNGIELGANYRDCGTMVYDKNDKEIPNGASGCGCCASVLSARILPRLAAGELKRVLVCATGALMNPTTVGQGKTIPAVAHLVRLSACERG